MYPSHVVRRIELIQYLSNDSKGMFLLNTDLHIIQLNKDKNLPISAHYGLWFYVQLVGSYWRNEVMHQRCLRFSPDDPMLIYLRIYIYKSVKGVCLHIDYFSPFYIFCLSNFQPWFLFFIFFLYLFTHSSEELDISIFIDYKGHLHFMYFYLVGQFIYFLATFIYFSLNMCFTFLSNILCLYWSTVFVNEIIQGISQ